MIKELFGENKGIIDALSIQTNLTLYFSKVADNSIKNN